jgi:hypothetical protein
MRRITWISLILGVWLIVSPFSLAHASTTAAMTNDIIVGILILASSAWIVGGMAAPIAVNGFEILCSIWLIGAPFVLHYQKLSQAVTNDVAVGIITLLVGLIEIWTLMIEPVKA